MKNYFIVFFLVILSKQLAGQVYESKYAVFDKKVVLVKGLSESSELLCIVPKGNPVRILEKLRGPVYKAKYKAWSGYLISFNLGTTFEKNLSTATAQRTSYKIPGNLYVTLSHKAYIKKRKEYKMIIAVPKGERVQVLEKVSKGKYLVKYKNHIGYCELGRFVVKDEGAQKSLKNLKINKSARENKFVESLPPLIKIADISFSNTALKAGEVNRLVITLENSGPGDASSVYVRLSGENRGIQYPEIVPFPTIKANGGVETITMNIDGNQDLANGRASIDIEVIESKFKVKIPAKRLQFETVELPKPNLIIAKYELAENRSARSNRMINLNEIVDLKFTIQNIGRADAEKLEVEVNSDQMGVMLLGVVNENEIDRYNPRFDKIRPGEYRTLTYRYFINSEFVNTALKFKIKANDQISGYRFSANLAFPINNQLEAEGHIRTITEQNPNNDFYRPDVPELIVDVDHDIPVSNSTQKNTYALIIGNEDYRSRQRALTKEQNAEYALNDAEVFKIYCERTLGIPAKQVKILRNATSAEISQGLAWINNLSKIEGGKAELIFYYSGHGMPDTETKSPVLVPVDVSVNSLRYGVKLSDAFASLIEHPAKQITVFLDACFSGVGKNEGLTAKKGIKVVPNKDIILGNMVVFSSSSGDQTSSVYREKKHGYFTYFLLKKLQETKGKVDYEGLSNYIINSVRKETGLNGIIQTPEVNFSKKVERQWKDWKLK